MNIQHVDYSSTDQRSLDYARERNSAWDVYSQPIQDNYYDQNQKITSSERDRQHGRDRSRRRDRERDKDRDRGSRYSRDKERDRSQNRHESDDYYDDSRSSFSDGNSYDNCDYNNLHNNGEDDYNSHITQNLPTASNKVCEVDDYYSDKRSSSYSDKKERHRDRDRERDRDSRPRTRDYDKDRDRDRDRRDHNRTGTSNWKEEKPNNTIMLRGLAQHISEADIRNELLIFGLEAKDIRLMRKKDTGASRGFAFVEFQTLAEAVRWMELKQGVVTFQGQYRGTMHYSIPKDGPYDRGVIKADWNCTKCGAHNFKRRDFCFKCNTSREEADQIRLGEGYDEVSNSPCNTLLFRNLDILTTEEKILAALQGLTALPIKNIRVAKDTLTNTSRGFCYVELNSTNEAVQLHDQLTGLSNMLFVDGKQISLSFAKQSLSSLVSASSASVASAAVAAAQWTNQAPQGTAYVPGVGHGSYSSHSTQNYSSCSSNSYSEYQQPYNRNGNFNQNYSTSYNQYYNQYNYPNYEGSSDTSKVSTNASTNDEKNEEKTSGKSSPDSSSQKGNEKFDTGDDKALIYAEPDVSTYQYDESSGYYYDPLTGLYYDASSQYYYNSELQQFLYWDSEKRTYMPAPSSSTGRPGSIDDDSFDKRSKEKDKQDKVKIAKKIAKDMEKWAKTLNQKKEIAKHGIIANPSIDNSKQSATADAGFAMLEKKTTLAERQQTVFEVMKKKELEDKKLMPPPGHSKGKDKSGGGLVAAYGGESDSEDDGEQAGVEFEACSKELEEARLTDWNKLACLLCKRQFPSKEALQRHQQLSDLHKQNLEKLRRPRGGEMDADEAERKQSESKYRDRAKERRQKYGEPEHPHPNKLKEKYLKQKTISYEEPTKQGIGSDNIGNKMLKAMGWNEGQGLGRANQGRIEIIETQRRTAAAGLGMRGGTYGATAGDSYKDTVKKMMQTRFNELSS